MPAEKVGPNRVMPSDSYTITEKDNYVKLRIGNDGIAAQDPISVPTLLNRSARDYPNHPALVYKNPNNVWQTVTYSEYKANVYKVAKAFIKLGLQPRHSVGILAFNSPEWFYSELAAIHAGGIVTGIYTTNSADAVYHVLSTSEANIVIVDDSKQMEKVRSIRHKLPHLKAVVQTLPPYEPFVKREDGYYRWSELEEMDVEEYTEELNNRLARMAINECCCLVFTSGTVGNPKGVMLSHDNITWDAFTIGKRLPGIQYGKETLISYLPLSHVAAQIVDIFLTLQFAVTVYFADKDALKGTLVKTLQEARPTRFLGVPRVYEKIQEKMLQVGAQNSGIKKMIATWAKSVTLEHHMNIIEGNPSASWQYKVAKNIILKKVKEALGLDRCQTIASAAAPMSPDLKKYFMSLDLPVMEAFGMSETTGGHSLTNPDSYNFNTIGRQLPGTETKIHEPDEKGHGEICMRGRNIFMGYLSEPEKTKDALDDEGWLHSGDIGYIDDRGFLYITGRLKELIITAGGENVPPVHVEHLVKNELPCVSNAFLVGDKRKYLTMLLALKTEMDVDSGAPKDELHPETLNWFKPLGVDYTKLSQVHEAGPCPKVLKALEDGIARANKFATSNAQKIQKFKLLPHDFSVPTGELGPTLKVKRNVVVNMYEELIESLYKD
ncbi:very long-chain-fatty-acid--CoA ligase bubblegum [Phlebotomus papatasi]|uniref:very long-chain-fatty-acid--CoA ligase bubblegum n=1 Tax=Phlebotomus papatasi TaxID=29031 RepID=UPI0024835DB5|nr:very long-chain-fatty-acid--CoA ligase bubblegum [Phlebotomus papatasi]XP_055713766.1 very long-chain-fatty-acid--CoA ligase bubblegum [Phlebotomus papatasi]XP_055713767.1 very long-chain-fatty-acid--CoA ligase bubblegum [Phlebotomus papatasi]XP_055713768.1 very long-chain-fatty-acid--CoA ligase bubblegum [Phlebotomus papatasi]